MSHTNYKIVLNSAMGIKDGLLTMVIENDLLTALIEIFGHTNIFSSIISAGDISAGDISAGDISAGDNNYVLSGSIKTSMGEVGGLCNLSISGDSVKGYIQTSKGRMSLNGSKINEVLEAVNND